MVPRVWPPQWLVSGRCRPHSPPLELCLEQEVLRTSLTLPRCPQPPEGTKGKLPDEAPGPIKAKGEPQRS